jgi:hypothetical protein
VFQHVAQCWTEFLPVVVSDHDVRGRVDTGVGNRGDDGPGVGLRFHDYGVDENRRVTEVPSEMEQVSRHR